ncbi:MAG: hypothetical protein P8X74_05915 [Reinekea sp.]
MFPQNLGEPTSAPAIFEKQRGIKLLHPASTLKSRIQVKRNASLTQLLYRFYPENMNKLFSFLGYYLKTPTATLLAAGLPYSNISK